MSEMGQNAKYSVRADVFRFASKLRHCSMQSALRICVKSGHIRYSAESGSRFRALAAPLYLVQHDGVGLLVRHHDLKFQRTRFCFKVSFGVRHHVLQVFFPLAGHVKCGQHRKGRNRRLKSRENRGQETKKSPAEKAGLLAVSRKSKKSFSHAAFLHFRGPKKRTGRQDHTTSPSASAPFVCAPSDRSRETRPAITKRAGTAASTASHPASMTMANAPLWDGMANHIV
jgi:hypothetical protein